MIINGSALLDAAPIKDMLTEKVRHGGVTHGLTEAGFDIRIAQTVALFPGRRFALVSALEEFQMPDNLIGIVHDKSTWARMGLAVQNTVIESGWEGFLTLELTYAGWRPLRIPAGVGIAQVLFHQIAEPARYRGRYQNQPARPVPAILEKRTWEVSA